MLLYTSFVLFASLPLSTASFYDNPELESPSDSGTPLDELKAKWDFDVSAVLSTFGTSLCHGAGGTPRQTNESSCLDDPVLKHHCAVEFFWYCDIRTPEAYQVLDGTVRAV
jgi:hypothetical protein